MCAVLGWHDRTRASRPGTRHDERIMCSPGTWRATWLPDYSGVAYLLAEILCKLRKILQIDASRWITQACTVYLSPKVMCKLKQILQLEIP
jgi:hypothetical protein